MLKETFDKFRKILADEAESIANAKRPGYTQGNSDVLKNFKAVAERVPCECPKCGHGFTLTAGQVWAVYFLKHVDALLTGLCRPKLPQAEALLGRFSDARNYGELGWGIANEEVESPLPTVGGPTSDPGIGSQTGLEFSPRVESQPRRLLEASNPEWRQLQDYGGFPLPRRESTLEGQRVRPATEEEPMAGPVS